MWSIVTSLSEQAAGELVLELTHAQSYSCSRYNSLPGAQAFSVQSASPVDVQ